jgi:hypothetical protein
VLPLYAYGALTTRNKGIEWETTEQPADPNVMKYMVPSVFYGLIGAGGLHLLSLTISLWLAVMFRRISLMPPDMNPLEANLTSRVHKRNKSSVATTSTYSDNEKRPDSELYDDHSRPPPVPFMHTRHGSDSSFGTRDSHVNLPDRQYQVAAGSRSSFTPQDVKRMSAPPSPLNRASYMEIPLGETNAKVSRPNSMYSIPAEGRPSSGSVASHRPESFTAPQTAQPRSAKFTENWYASESLVNRTQQRKRLQKQGNVADKLRNYESLRHQNLDLPDSDSENDENNNSGNYNHHPSSPSSPNHPNPLRSNPTPASSPPAQRRPRTPFSRLRASILSEVQPNDRRVSGDITDSKPHLKVEQQQRVGKRLSSIQHDESFYSKPYGDLKPGTPPVIIGGNRQVSSGHDYYESGGDLGGVGRRHVSGREAEEGMAGGETGRWSRYGGL